MFRIAICEDDLLQLEVINELLKKYECERPGISIHSSFFQCASQVISSIDVGNEYDLFLLDILMPKISGISLAKKLRDSGTDVPLVFLTSTADYALDAFNVSAAQYILKPINYDKLFPILDKFILEKPKDKEPLFLLITYKNVIKIPFNSIVYVELSGKTVRFYLNNKSSLLSSAIRTSFADAIKPLLNDERFLSPHKSFAINMEHVKEISPTAFIMNGDFTIPIPKYNFSKAKAKYLEWIDKHNGIINKNF